MGFAEALTVIITSILGTGLLVAESLRRMLRRRDERFREAVQAIVDQSIMDVIRRQTDFERRQGQHLDRQDKAIRELRDLVERRPRRLPGAVRGAAPFMQDGRAAACGEVRPGCRFQ